ncbi:MAG: DUF4292 domain-containing protein [Bacteroides sp.]|nr:DUF4292 domain-containing protein [Bacteroides sp.]
MKREIKIGTFVLGTILLLASCKTSKVVTRPTDTTVRYVSSKLQLTVPNRSSTLTLNGTMKMMSPERIQLSVLVPILRSEAVRIDLTPDEVLVVDRMNRRYIRASREDLRDILLPKAEFFQLEKMIFAVAEKGDRVTLTAAELGLPTLEKAKVEFYDFSFNEFTMTPTEISGKYDEMTVDELLAMLNKLKL